LFGHVACLDPGVPAHDALRLMVDTYEGRKASWRRPAGHPLNVWLNKVQEDANALLLSTLWRSEIARSHGAERRSLGLYETTMMVMMMMMKDDYCVKNGG